MGIARWISSNCRFAQTDDADDVEVWERNHDDFDETPKPGWTPYSRRPDASHTSDDRPHGSNSKDDGLEIAEQGVLSLDDFVRRFQDLEEDIYRLGQKREDLRRNRLPPMPHKFVAYVLTNVSKKLKPWALRDPMVIYHGGWDNSFHDARWTGHSMIAGMGATEAEAKTKLQEAINASVTEDPVKKRFDLRNMVRPGD